MDIITDDGYYVIGEHEGAPVEVSLEAVEKGAVNWHSARRQQGATWQGGDGSRWEVQHMQHGGLEWVELEEE
jgi:hypothetical protein